MRQFLTCAALATCLAATAGAATVSVDIYGEIEYNQIRNGLLNKVDVPAGSAVHIHFLLDSDVYTDDGTYPTRGYAIDQSSFAATYGSVTVGIESPYPYTPYFVLRNNDPMVDGFFLSNGTTWPTPITTSEPGIFGQLGVTFETSYDMNMLPSLDILDALGTWDYNGLSSLYFSTDDGGFDAMGLYFDHTTIATVPSPAGLAIFVPMVMGRRRR